MYLRKSEAFSCGGMMMMTVIAYATGRHTDLYSEDIRHHCHCGIRSGPKDGEQVEGFRAGVPGNAPEARLRDQALSPVLVKHS